MSIRIDQGWPATRPSAGGRARAAVALSCFSVEPCDHHRRREAGFTLIELMITVVVISILAAIALPSYQSYVRQARRVEAQASLIDLQQDLEKWRVNNASYSGCPSDSCSAPASDYYDFSVTSADATSYSLQAAAKGTQATDTGCTPLTLDQDSVKGPAGCWKQ